MISNSTNSGEEFLSFSLSEIKRVLQGVKELLFIPYAAVSISYDEYEQMVRERLCEINIDVRSIHHSSSALQEILRAEAICVGGGNTFALTATMQRLGLFEAIRERVMTGVPYIGWSAGSNIAAPTIGTTNDMPIIEVESLAAINLIPFQINPHYIDSSIEGHAGESREQRIEEYIEVNRDRWVVGLREGTMLSMESGLLELLGDKSMRVFRYGEQPREVTAGESLQFLL